MTTEEWGRTGRKGDSFFLSAGSGNWQIEGTCDALLTTIREKASPIRAGIIIGSAETRTALVNDQQQIIAEHSFPTNTGLAAERIIEETAHAVLDMLEEQGIPLDQCIGAGVGVPGTIDSRRGTVLYSNNLKWENVPAAAVMQKYIPCPVRIANDADCAALGEAVAGAGKHYTDVVLFTLGNGVGGGIIIGGRVFEGGMTGGSEVGHQAVLLDVMMTEQVRELIAPLREMIKLDSFGNVHGPLPEIAAAELGADAGVIGAANL